MFLKSIELKGFKSFADRTHIDFLPGVTCIVGPNGCGKSNIIDAIRWVLGEQSSTSLRARRMEDVIFSGTKHRSSQNFASVRLVFSGAAKLSPGGLDELSVERILHRSGESSYKINGLAVRLKDLRQLFMDTAVGVSGYSLISQGDIDDILKENKEDRRKIFEEASGISLIHYKKEEAKRRLLRVESHYLRMMDILGELEERREPLLEEKEKALRYLSLANKAKELDLFYAREDYLSYEKEEEELQRSLRRSQFDLEQLIGKKSAMQEEKVELEEKRNELEKEYELLQSLLRDKAKQRDEGYLELRLKEERHRQLQRDMDQLRNEESLFQEDGQLLNKVEETKVKKEAVAAHLLELKEQIKSLEVLQSLHHHGVEQIQDKKDKVNRELRDKNTELLHLQRKKSELQENLNKHSQEKAELLASIGLLHEEKKKLAELLLPLERQALRQKREKRELEDNARILEEERSDLKTRLAELNSQITALDKNIQLYETWEEEGERNLEEIRELLGGEILYKKIRPHKGYEKALEAALSQGLNSLDLRGSTTDQWLSRIGNTSINLVYGSPIPEIFQDAKSLGSLANFVSGPADLCQSLLGGVLVYTTIEEALAGPQKSVRVSLKGERLEKGLYYGAQSVASPMEVSLKLEEGRNEKASLEKTLIELEAIRLKKDQEASENLQRLHAHAQEEENFTRKEKELREKERHLYSEERLLSFKSERSETLFTEWQIQREDLEEFERKLTQSLQALQREEKDLETLEESADPHRLEEFQEKNLRLRLEEARAMEEERRWEEELHALARRLEDQEKRQQIKEGKQEEYNRENQGLLNILDQLREDHGVLQDEIKKLDTEAFTIKKQRDLLRSRLIELEKKREPLEEELYKLHDQQSKKEIRLSRIEERKKALSEEIWRLYEMSMLQIKDMELFCDEPRNNRKKIRQEMTELEPVNLKAPEEFEEVDERHQFLKGQLEDVLKSKKDLESTIHSLERRMKEEFVQTFTAIRENFKEIFSHLFRGGQGDILLEDPSDVLGTDILILASPPGKKLQHMNLLSGGEKALTAIALLFAVLRTKPAPFYVLDEIEAALDDINIQRFGTFLEEFSKGSQFILITHRKGTMEFADALYGVSMEEKGISSLVSLKMEEE